MTIFLFTVYIYSYFGLRDASFFHYLFNQLVLNNAINFMLSSCRLAAATHLRDRQRKQMKIRKLHLQSSKLPIFFWSICKFTLQLSPVMLSWIYFQSGHVCSTNEISCVPWRYLDDRVSDLLVHVPTYVQIFIEPKTQSLLRVIENI